MMSIPGPVMSEKSKKSAITEQANESTTDQTSQLSFSSIDEVIKESNVKIEIDETYDCDNGTMIFVAERNNPSNSEETNVKEPCNKPKVKVEEIDVVNGCRF
ncbi:uncharacterized protein LOC126835707 isoform X2 [Adelges cooleyi]|uniref:uncharacterized protein LOC126835707 isoform X2 n=1 Tax=Adelges cooleyi TaxID=133065 RepID=UPI00217F78B3|nr:uncharacterized protein LOC126835707 isoform X2 [Adelges cooleyi]